MLNQKFNQFTMLVLLPYLLQTWKHHLKCVVVVTNNLALTAEELVLSKVVLSVYYTSVDQTGLDYNFLYKVECISGNLSGT